jgi:biopolymer transport protein ExbB
MIPEITLQLAATAPSGSNPVWEFLSKGGIFMLPLAATSIIAVMAIVYKFLSLAPNRVLPESLARDVAAFQERLSSNLTAPVVEEFEKGESSLARLASIALRHRGKPQGEIIQAVEASAREETAHLHSGIGVLDIVITIAPLLGLLGTASGLVTIFKGLGETTDHLAIAHGIAEALNTTIVGLTIAVPCVVAHGYFSRRIEIMTARLESLLSDLAHVCQGVDPHA